MSDSMGSNAAFKDVNMDLLRERSNMLSLNLSKESLIYLDSSSILYIDRMEA